eukprot:TRINITY_DN1716_c0_g2_i1.p1 TRINITY_DN1716_c0_g2~~TRINITY_DN1716_c0_g2_i1.p1  ORF type:complete len:249 (-),score=45.19 TRINITY_DN1716_c0_g2_i1:108-854(-)
MPTTKTYHNVDVTAITQQIATLGTVSKASIPHLLIASNVGAHLFTLDWKYANEELPAIQYEIELRCGNNIKKFQSNITSFSVQHLEPGKEYDVEVCVITKEGKSEWSEAIKVETKPIITGVKVMQEHGHPNYPVSHTLQCIKGQYWCSNDASPPQADPLAYQFDRNYTVCAIEIWPHPSFSPKDVVIERNDGNNWIQVKKIIVEKQDKIQVFDGFSQTGSQWRLRLITGYHKHSFGIYYVGFVGEPAW